MATYLLLASLPIGLPSPQTFNKKRMKQWPAMPKRNSEPYRLLKPHKKPDQGLSLNELRQVDRVDAGGTLDNIHSEPEPVLHP